MKRRHFTLAATIAAAMALATSTAGAEVDEHAGLILTKETNCFETADRRPVLASHLESYVPDRYAVVATAPPPAPAWTGPPDVLAANVGFIDYVCEGLSVNGHRPRPTIVSIGSVLVRRDGVQTNYVLWVGTDNPLYFARLQQLGVNAHFIPRSSYSETTNAAGRRELTVRYVDSRDDGLNYTRAITVLTAPDGPTRQSIGGPVYHMGSEGEVSITWFNTFQPNGTANVCFGLGAGSLPAQHGITSFCFPGPRTFFRGSWDGRIEVLS